MPDAHESHAIPAELANGVIPMLDVSRYLAGDRSELDRLGRELRTRSNASGSTICAAMTCRKR